MMWDLDGPQFTELVELAIRAPSVHNTQPWRFRYDPRGIDVLVDEDRLLPASDPSGRAAHLSCGAAAYTCQLALAMRGTPAEILVRPTPAEPPLLARLIPARPRPPTPLERRLHVAVPRRHSNRHPFADEPVPVAARSELISAATAEGGWLDLIIGSTAIDATAALVRTADTLLNQNPAYRRELRAWTRSDPNAPDGVPAGAGGPAPRPDELLARRDFGGSERPGLRDYEREPLIAALGVAGERPADEVRAGLCLQRVLLTATDLGLATSMFSQPIDVPAVREELRLALGRRYAPMMLLRFGYPVRLATSARRPVHEVMDRAMCR
jgi:nitroreductase